MTIPAQYLPKTTKLQWQIEREKAKVDPFEGVRGAGGVGPEQAPGIPQWQNILQAPGYMLGAPETISRMPPSPRPEGYDPTRWVPWEQGAYPTSEEFAGWEPWEEQRKREYTEAYEEIPLWRKLAYELPVYAAIPGATGAKAAMTARAATAGKAAPFFKAGAKAITPVVKVEQAPAKILEKALTSKAIEKLPAVQKLREVLKISKGVRTEQEVALYTPERAARFTEAELRMARAPAGQKLIAAKSALKGELPKAKLDIPENLKWTPDNIIELEATIDSLPLRVMDKVRALEAIQKWPRIFSGVSPEVMQKGEIALLNKIFFPREAGLGAKAWYRVLDLANAPRAVLASVDLSATLRQGLFETIDQGFRHPVRTGKTFWNSARMLLKRGGPKLYNELDDALRADPELLKWRGSGSYFSPKAGQLERVHITAREEFFPSAIAEKLPFVKRSEMAYTYYLNKMRLDGLKDAGINLSKLGAKVGDGNYRLMSQLMNYSTGRGNIDILNKMFGGNVGPILNASLFSPKLLMSRFQFPITASRALANPMVRKEAARRLVAGFGLMTGIATTLKSTGMAEVALDPRSADWGKLKIGNTRMDLWAGYQQIMRFMIQFAKAERKTQAGELVELNRKDLILQFLQSKAAPSVGFILDLLAGETYYGEELGTPRYVREKLVPLFLQDVWDASEDRGILGAGIVAPAFLGVGAMTYEPTGKIRTLHRELKSEVTKSKPRSLHR